MTKTEARRLLRELRSYASLVALDPNAVDEVREALDNIDGIAAQLREGLTVDG